MPVLEGSGLIASSVTSSYGNIALTTINLAGSTSSPRSHHCTALSTAAGHGAPYVVLSVKRQVQTTTIAKWAHNSHSWNEEFSFKLSSTTDSLTAHVKDHAAAASDGVSFLGTGQSLPRPYNMQRLYQ